MQGRVPIVSRLCCSEFFLLTAGKCSRSFFVSSTIYGRYQRSEVLAIEIWFKLLNFVVNTF